MVYIIVLGAAPGGGGGGGGSPVGGGGCMQILSPGFDILFMSYRQVNYCYLLSQFFDSVLERVKNMTTSYVLS